jgi:hypothetical protein
MKDEAKTAGIDTNIRTMLAVAENAIDDATPVSLGGVLDAKAEGELKNPVSKSTTSSVLTALTDVTVTEQQSFVYLYGPAGAQAPYNDAAAARADVVSALTTLATDSPTNLDYLKGAVIACPIGSGNEGTGNAVLTEVCFMGVGADGLVSTSDQKLAVYTVKK